ncbi:unnamed protein product [Toxocara canis]|uniref:Uncharacterized protein n=1 Tax=Toxocara canis TaxID=6265 RepID=A0A183V5W9_TOXCA|nr:unnamed protein product [Toxocara canis]
MGKRLERQNRCVVDKNVSRTHVMQKHERKSRAMVPVTAAQLSVSCGKQEQKGRKMKNNRACFECDHLMYIKLSLKMQVQGQAEKGDKWAERTVDATSGKDERGRSEDAALRDADSPTFWRPNAGTRWTNFDNIGVIRSRRTLGRFS